VHVASYGKNAVIQAYLNRALPGLFPPEHVSTPATVGGTDGHPLHGGKNPQLEDICERKGLKMERLLFFDDDFKNVEQAESSSVLAVHCPEAFLESTWEGALDLIKKERKLEVDTAIAEEGGAAAGGKEAEAEAEAGTGASGGSSGAHGASAGAGAGAGAEAEAAGTTSGGATAMCEEDPESLDTSTGT